MILLHHVHVFLHALSIRLFVWKNLKAHHMEDLVTALVDICVGDSTARWRRRSPRFTAVAVSNGDLKITGLFRVPCFLGVGASLKAKRQDLWTHPGRAEERLL